MSFLQMSESEKREMEERFFKKYGFTQTAEQLMAPTANYNYYSDSRLIEAVATKTAHSIL
jgi:hypothetical protein